MSAASDGGSVRHGGDGDGGAVAGGTRLGSPMRDKPAARRPPAGLRIERSRPAGRLDRGEGGGGEVMMAEEVMAEVLMEVV